MCSYSTKILPGIEDDWRKEINEEKIFAEHKKVRAFPSTYK